MISRLNIFPGNVLAYWLGNIPCKQMNAALWYSSNPTLDEDIRSKFTDIHSELSSDPFKYAVSSSESSSESNILGSIIVLDQFSRNMFRGTPKAFEQDSAALQLSQKLLIDYPAYDIKEFGPYEWMFVLLPFMHSEDLSTQEAGFSHFTNVNNFFGGEVLKGACSYSDAHLQVIKQYGRFPHRNAFLGRISTEEELEYLSKPGSGF
eukprot:gene9580-12904_t